MVTSTRPSRRIQQNGLIRRIHAVREGRRFATRAMRRSVNASTNFELFGAGRDLHMCSLETENLISTTHTAENMNAKGSGLGRADLCGSVDMQIEHNKIIECGEFFCRERVRSATMTNKTNIGSNLMPAGYIAYQRSIATAIASSEGV